MFACWYVPDFSVQAVLLAETKEARERLRRSPVAVLDGPSNVPRVAALNDVARNLGIVIGMTKPQVEACSAVVLRKRSLDVEDAAQATLLECANTFSPRVEATCPGTVILDLAGTEKLFGPLETVACKMKVGVRQAGLQARTAIAANPDTAMFAALGFAGITVVPAGRETQTLGPLSVNLLPASPVIIETLEDWGIHTFKALAALPTVALVERLGQEGLALQKLAQGQTCRALEPVAPLPDFVESYEFDGPVETLESLAFVLNRVLKTLCDRLVAQSLATNELRLTLDLEVRQRQGGEYGEQYKRDWKLPVSTQDRNMLFTLLRLDLERNTFVAPIKRFTLEAVPLRPRTAQGNLFAPPSPEMEQLEITLARIRGVVGCSDATGTSCVGSPQVLDTHRSGAFAVQAFSTAHDVCDLPGAVPVLALRMFRPALETSVELMGEAPHFVRLWKKHRRVLAAFGPWSSSGNWWSNNRWARDEWDVALKTHDGIGYYRIYRDFASQQWFVEGMFD